MRRPYLVALATLAFAFSAAMACTSLKVDEPGPAVDGSAPPSDGATPLPDGAPSDGTDAARNDAAKSDAAACPTGCNGKAVSTCNGTTSETTLGLGQCVAGQCVYPKVSRPCRSACSGGLCTELTWSASTAPTAAGPYYAVWGAAPDDLWAGGDTLAHFDGRAWSETNVATTFGAGKRIFALSGSSRRDVALLVGNPGGGAYQLYRLENGIFAFVEAIPNCDLAGGSLYARSATEYFVHCGERGIYRVATDATPRLSTIVANPGSFAAGQTLSNALSGVVFSDGELSLMAAGASVSYFYSSDDGGKVQTGGTRAVSVLNAQDVFGFLQIGLDAVLYPTDGGAAVTTALNAAIGETGGYWRSMVGTRKDRIFVGGSRGVIAHYDGVNWHRDAVPEASVDAPFVSLWASPWGDVYGTGQRLWEGR